MKGHGIDVAMRFATGKKHAIVIKTYAVDGSVVQMSTGYLNTDLGIGNGLKASNSSSSSSPSSSPSSDGSGGLAGKFEIDLGEKTGQTKGYLFDFPVALLTIFPIRCESSW